MQPISNVSEEILTCQYFDVSDTPYDPDELAQAVSAARQELENIFREDPSFNDGFEPIILVFGRSFRTEVVHLLQHAGAFYVNDLDMPGNGGRTAEDHLREMDEVMRKPIVIHEIPIDRELTSVADDPSAYYQPLTENEPAKIAEYLRILNSQPHD